MKEGLIYISDRLGQLRYSDKDDKIKWLQPLSSYKALVEIKRGQAVSVATLDEIKSELSNEQLVAYEENPSPYIVPTNTKIHNRCIGLALETVEFGADVHILGSGQFEYITDNSNEYNPGFTDDDISKKVYVSNKPGELTTDSEVAYKKYNNIIQIGHIIDAPNLDANPDTQKKIILEVQIQGDDRGILESTQFEAVLGEDVYIGKDEPLTVFAFGQEEASKFKLKLCTRNMTSNFTQEQLNASFIIIKKLSGEYSLIKFSNSEIVTEDTTDKSTLELLKNRYEPKNGYYEIEDIDFTNSGSSIETIKGALNVAIKEMGEDLTFEESEYSPGEDFSSVILELSEEGGYYDIYISNSLKDFLRDTTTLQNGSLYNKNRVVLADIRVDTRRNVFGVLVNKLEDDKLFKTGDRILLMRQGELVIDTKRKLTDIGKKFVLGENGTVISADKALRTADFSNTIGYLKKTHEGHYHFVIDIGENIPKVDYSTYPVGYLKPYYGSTEEGKESPDFGYLLTNKTYPIEEYKELYERLLGWYDESIINNGEDRFNIPEIKDINGIPMQIKYVTDGIFERLPKVPYLRDFGNISETESHSCKIEDLDITALLSINTTFSEVDTLPLENLDIHLYIDPDYTEGEHNWREVYPGFYKYNNVDTYGFEWKIKKEPATEEDIYGKYILSAEIGDDGRGIYYTSSDNIAPISCANVPYKLYVAVKQINIEHFDLRNLMSNYISSTVYNNNGEIDDVYAVTGEAVINAIRNNEWFKSLKNATEDSVVNFGGDKKLNTIVDIQTNEAIRLNCTVEPTDKNSVLIGETIEETEGNTTIYTTLEIKDGKAFLRKLNTNLFALDSNNEFVNDGKEVATINDILDHALMSIDGSSDTVKKAIENNNNNDKGVIHGMRFGKDGNVDASTLCNYKVGIAYGQEITNYNEAIVSIIHKDVEGVHTPLQGNIDYYTNLSNDEQSTKLFTLVPSYETEGQVLDLAFTKDDNPVDKISFGTATIVAATESPSLSRYKTIYKENKINDGRFTTELDEGSKPTADDKISFDFAYILQAAYELPMAYWKYRNSDEYNIGPIIERLQDTINYFEKKDVDITYTIDGDEDPYKYTTAQKSGIAKSLKDIIAESGKSVRADDMVGFLLAAAGETQKRLAKLERSTYGRDVMEGKIIEFDNMPDVTPDHTKYGLNRLVRAICLELFQTADPGKLDVDENTKTSLSRIDDIERQIRGSKKNPDSAGSIANNNINNFEDADDEKYSISSSYPYREDIENDINAEAIKNENTFKVNDKPSVTLTKETIFGTETANDTDSFNGVVDAIYRITQKVDVLTEAINGTNDILQPHTTLNKIKRNIETLIKEVYFDGKNGEDAYKDILGKGETFNETNESRVDKITEDLYTYRLEYENCGDDQDLTSSEKLDKYNYPNASYNSDIKKFDIVSPENIAQYNNNLSIIDIILKAIGNQILLKHYDDQNNSAKNLRFNKDISDRLYSIEQCLDKVVLRLKDNTYFEDFTKTDFKYDETTTLNLDEFSEALSKLLGYTYNKTDNGEGKFSPTEGVVPTPPDAPNPENSRKFSAEYALRTKSNIVAGLENILYRVQNEEKDNLHIKEVLGEELMSGVDIETDEAGNGNQDTQTLTKDTKFTLSDDIKDLLATIYGEAATNVEYQIPAGDNTYYGHRTKTRGTDGKGSFLNGENIIENIVNELYYIPQPYDKDFSLISKEDLTKTDNIYVTYNNNVNENFFEGSLIAGNNREHNFKSLAKSGRPSRLDILESDIKALRKFIGLTGFLSDENMNSTDKKIVAVQGNFSFDKDEDGSYGIKDSSYEVGSKDPLTSSFIESFFNLMKRVDVVENTNTSQSKSIEAINNSITTINTSLEQKANNTSLQEAVSRIDTLDSDIIDLQDKKFAIENIINLDDETGVLEVYSKKAVENLLKTTAEDINTNVAELKASVDEFNNIVGSIDNNYTDLSNKVKVIEDVLEKDNWNESENNLFNKQEGTDAIITLNNFKKFRYLLPDSPIAQEYYNIKGENDVAFCNATIIDDNEYGITIDMKNTTSINIYVTDFETINSEGDDKVYKPFIYNLSRNPIVTFVTEPTSLEVENLTGSYMIGDTNVQLSIPTVNGYTFDGWYEGDDKLNNQEYTVTEDVTLTAKFINEDTSSTGTEG